VYKLLLFHLLQVERRCHQITAFNSMTPTGTARIRRAISSTSSTMNLEPPVVLSLLHQQVTFIILLKVCIFFFSHAHFEPSLDNHSQPTTKGPANSTSPGHVANHNHNHNNNNSSATPPDTTSQADDQRKPIDAEAEWEQYQ